MRRTSAGLAVCVLASAFLATRSRPASARPGDSPAARPTRAAGKGAGNQREVKARPLDHVPSGTWGGEHIALEVTEKGATIEYDCAHGSIDAPLALDADGRLDVKGMHVRERPGPTRPGQDEGRAARYTGKTDGKTLTLTVTLDGGETLGTFQLTLGAEPRIFRCA